MIPLSDKRLVRYRIEHKDDGCWIWTGGQNGVGYGVLSLRRGRKILAHRFMYEVWREPIPEDMELDHLCRVKLCVNPFHLEIVTHAENMRRGKNARLTMQQAREIRRLYATGRYRQIDLGRRFGVSRPLIGNILTGRKWRETEHHTSV